MYQVIECAKDAGVSAIIASDIAAILYARSIGVEVHISTQCNITNYEAGEVLCPICGCRGAGA